MENYEERYKEALERAKECLQDGTITTIARDYILEIFPEFQESKDERIRKEIIDFLGLPHPQFVGKRDHEKWIAWLEKQSEKKGYTFKSIPRLLNMIIPSEKAKFYCQKLIDTLTKEGYDTDAKIVANCLKQMNGEEVAMATMDEDEKQGENKSAEDDKMRREILELVSISGIDYNQYEEIKDWLEKQGKNKPAENVEIKFCEGDKVVSNQDGNLYTVGTEYYITGDNICLHDTDGNHLWTNRDDLEKNYHLWTLKDAKDGDVLASVGKGGQEVGIVKRFIGKYGGHNKCFETYCYSDLDGTFRIGEYMGGNSIHPATKKKQCAKLFQQMKELGYEWDADKKEVKKIEQKSADKVEPKFKPGDCIVFNGPILYIDEVVNGYYRTTSIGDGIHNSYDWNIDNAARLWTIQEAKDGNVLVDEDNNIGIYVGKKDDFWHSCIYLGCDSCLRKIGGYHKCNNTKPATKEQRYLLFQKMKKEGYEWDSEKNELKKVEQGNHPRIVMADLTGGVVSTKYKETRCTHFHLISGIQRWCDKGVFPPDCATCTQGDWEEYWVEVTSTSTKKED